MWREIHVPPAQLNTIIAAIGDGGGLLSDALLDAIECTPYFRSEEDVSFSQCSDWFITK